MTLGVFNTVLAVSIFFACVDVVRRMNRRTDCAVRWAALLILAGGIGEAAAYGFDRWYYYADSLLWGGILALLIADKRGMPADHETRMFVPRWWSLLPSLTWRPASWLPFARSIVRWSSLEASAHPRRWASYGVTLGTLIAMLGAAIAS